jgi:hypothetical protein
MNHFLTYTKHSYEIILEAESKLCIDLQHETEAYVVHLFAKFMDRPNINTQPIGIKMLEAVHKSTKERRKIFNEVGDECLIINSFGYGKNRWPTQNYYKDMGTLAYDQTAHTNDPPDDLFIELAKNFTLISKVLNKCTNFNDDMAI